MRRKTFDVLFETRDGMRLLVQERCMWRSLWYFALSVGLFSGVVTNQLFLDQALSVRFAVIAAAVSIAGVVLSMYGFLLHGILETLGAMAGDAVGLICLLGYTTLPFLVMTPVALLGIKKPAIRAASPAWRDVTISSTNYFLIKVFNTGNIQHQLLFRTVPASIFCTLKIMSGTN